MSEIITNSDPNFFCSIQSREISESLMASAPAAKIWFMLEFNGKWGSKAFEDSTLSHDFKNAMKEKMAVLEKSRLLLIKQDKSGSSKKSFFIALADHNPPILLKFQFEEYEELLKLDFSEIIEHPDSFSAQISSEAIFLICSNGLRDKCCARNGAPIFQQLKNEIGPQLWQSTHHGGHRFSANMLYMPNGLSFGQIDLGNPLESIRMLMNGEIPLIHYRGNSTFPKIVQAGESLLLHEIGIEHSFNLTFQDASESRNGLWLQTFSRNDGQIQYSIEIKRTETDKMIYASCIGEKQVPVVNYELISINKE